MALAKPNVDAQSELKRMLRGAAGDAAPPSEGFKTTIMAGLDADDFVKPKILKEEDLMWLLTPTTMDDLTKMGGYLEEVAKDVMDIAHGFINMFSNAPIETFDDLMAGLEKFYMEVIMGKDLDMEKTKDYVDGMLIRSAVLAGTAIPELEEMNEKGCINMKDPKKDASELACLFAKFELLEKAIEMRQMMTFHQLHMRHEEMEWCDSVFMLGAHPENITAPAVADAMVEMAKCMMRNGGKIEQILNPDAPNADGEPMVPMLPVPRLIHLSVKMEVYEYMGMMAHNSFMMLEKMKGDGPEEEKMEKVRALGEVSEEKKAEFKDRLEKANKGMCKK